MNAIRKLASHTAIYGLSIMLGRFLNVLLVPLYTYYFENPADYGVISIIYAYVTFLNILYTFGMETGYFYFSNNENEKGPVAGSSFLYLLFSSLLLSGLMILLSPWLAELMGFAANPEYVVYLALILFFDTLIVIPFAMLRKQERVKKFTALKVASILLNILFVVFFIIFCSWVLRTDSMSFLRPFVQLIYTPGKEIQYILLSNVLASGITFLLLIPDIRGIRLAWDSSLWKKMIRYSWPLLFIGFAGMINETIDRIMLDKRLLVPPLDMTMEEARQQVGIYSACYKFSIFMTLAIQSFRFAAEPFFFAHLKKEGGKEVYAGILKYFSFVTGFIFLFVLMYMGMFQRFIGPEYRSGLNIVPILLIANLFLGIYTYLSQWYKQTEKNLYGAYISIGGALVTIAINYFLIPRYGYMASAWATLVVYSGMTVVSYFLGQRFFPVSYPVGKITLYILTAVALYFVSHFILEAAGEWNIFVYAINTLLLVGYLALFVWQEKDMTAKILLTLKAKTTR